jgi:uncharacterized membrane protein (DUF2068 family)
MVINPKKKLNTWSNTLKLIFLIIAILIFYPIEFYLILPNIGIIENFVIFIVYLFIVVILIRRWSFKRYGKEEFD